MRINWLRYVRKCKQSSMMSSRRDWQQIKKLQRMQVQKLHWIWSLAYPFLLSLISIRSLRILWLIYLMKFRNYYRHTKLQQLVLRNTQYSLSNSHRKHSNTLIWLFRKLLRSLQKIIRKQKLNFSKRQNQLILSEDKSLFTKSKRSIIIFLNNNYLDCFKSVNPLWGNIFIKMKIWKQICLFV